MRREASEARWSTERSVDAALASVEAAVASVDAPVRPTDPHRFSGKKPAGRGFVRFVSIFCIGVAGTLAWQSYGDAAREAIADSYPQLGWLAPQAAALAQSASDVAPTTSSADGQQLQTMSLGLTAMRQSVDQLTAQLAAGQERLAGDIAKLQTAQQEILDKIPAPLPHPAAATPRKPAAVTLQPSQAAPIR